MAALEDGLAKVASMADERVRDAASMVVVVGRRLSEYTSNAAPGARKHQRLHSFLAEAAEERSAKKDPPLNRWNLFANSQAATTTKSNPARQGNAWRMFRKDGADTSSSAQQPSKWSWFSQAAKAAPSHGRQRWNIYRSEPAAASRLQRWWRKRPARQSAKAQKAAPSHGGHRWNICRREAAAASRLQRWWRERSAPSHGGHRWNICRSEAGAASRLQRWWRKRPAEQSAKAQKAAPSHGGHRWNICRKEAEAASRLQRWWRGRSAPSDGGHRWNICRSEARAASRLQRWWRLRNVRGAKHQRLESFLLEGRKAPPPAWNIFARRAAATPKSTGARNQRNNAWKPFSPVIKLTSME